MYLPPTTSFAIERKATQRFSNALAFFISFPILSIIYEVITGTWHDAYLGSDKILVDAKFALNIFLPTIIILWFFAQKANIKSNIPKALVPTSEFDATPFSIGDRILLCVVTATIATIFAVQAAPILITQITGTPGKWSGMVTGKKKGRSGHGFRYSLSMSTTSKGIDIRDLTVTPKFWDAASIGDTVNIDGRLSRYGILQQYIEQQKHQTAANTIQKSKTRTAMPSALSAPALNDEALRAPDK